MISPLKWIQNRGRRILLFALSLSQFIPRRFSLVIDTMDTLYIPGAISPGYTKAAGPGSHLPSHRIFLPIFGNTYNV